MKLNRKIAALTLAAVAALGLAGCSSDADTVSANLSKEADDFKVDRRVVLYNGITDTYTLAVTGKCALNNDSGDSVTCKTPEGKYLKHIFRMGDNMTLFAEQLAPAGVSNVRYKVYFAPEQIIPDLDMRTSK